MIQVTLDTLHIRKCAIDCLSQYNYAKISSISKSNEEWRVRAQRGHGHKAPLRYEAEREAEEGGRGERETGRGRAACFIPGLMEGCVCRCNLNRYLGGCTHVVLTIE